MKRFALTVIALFILMVVSVGCSRSFSYRNKANGLSVTITHKFGSKVEVSIGSGEQQTKIFMHGDFGEFSPLRISIPNDDSREVYFLDRVIDRIEGDYYKVKVIDEYIVRDWKTIWIDPEISPKRKNLSIIVYYQEIKIE